MKDTTIHGISLYSFLDEHGLEHLSDRVTEQAIELGSDLEDGTTFSIQIPNDKDEPDLKFHQFDFCVLDYEDSDQKWIQYLHYHGKD